jgi:tetratricopeptide (TPR) repeat protein
MGAFLPDYNDPIVSILLLLGIIFAVSVVSYGYSIWKQEQKQKELLNFLKSFESNECTLDTKNMPFDEGMKKPLFLLALSYQKSGEYSKAINLYLYLLKHTKDNSILSHLAEAYHKAGFLKRSVDIYKEILHQTPRNKDVLYKLEFSYEQLREYNKANEVLDILEVLGENVSKYKSNLKLQKILKGNLQKDKKFEKLTNLLKDSSLTWPILRELFILNPNKAWIYYQDKEFKNLIDILYKLDIIQLNLDIISNHTNLTKLYYTKGFLQNSLNNKETIFAIDLLASAKESGFNKGTLGFKFNCSKCKSTFPIMAYRCPNCHRVYSFNIEVTIEQQREKSSYSLL